MAETVCPNCGHHLADYRVDCRPVGKRQVVLQWARCTHCRHVGLRRWHFADGPLPNPSSPERPPVERRERERTKRESLS